MFWVISVYFNVRNILPGTPVYTHRIYIYIYTRIFECIFEVLRTFKRLNFSRYIGLTVSKEICYLVFMVVCYVAVTEGPVKDSTFPNIVFVNLTLGGKSIRAKNQ